MAKVNFFILRFLIFWLVFAGTLFVINYFMSNFHFGAVGDAGASIKVWLDTNGDGKKDNNEPVLPNVCFWSGYITYYESDYNHPPFNNWKEFCNNRANTTDTDGAWSEFLPGGNCTDYYNVINPPGNYFPTTPVLVNDCNAEFGLSQGKATSKTPSINVGQYLQNQVEKKRILEWIKIITFLVSVSLFSGFITVKIIRPQVFL
jgi:hypothetical protein